MNTVYKNKDGKKVPANIVQMLTNVENILAKDGPRLRVETINSRLTKAFDPAVISDLKSPKKLEYDASKKEVYLKAKYSLNNKEDLKNLVKNSKYGILREDLKYSYRKVERDIDDLVQDKTFRKIGVDEDNRSHILIYRDKNGEIEKFMNDPVYAESVANVRKIWNETPKRALNKEVEKTIYKDKNYKGIKLDEDEELSLNKKKKKEKKTKKKEKNTQ